MTSPRIATSILLRASRSSIPRASRQFRPVPAHTIRPALVTSQFRPYSSQLPPTKPSKIYFFPDIKAHLSSPKSYILIDAREPSELQTTGTIPGALNIPITSKPDSFFITAEEFEDRFGFERPAKDQEVVFFCRSGVRSRAAAELAKTAGWEKVGEYPGSWLDWEKMGGEKEGKK